MIRVRGRPHLVTAGGLLLILIALLLIPLPFGLGSGTGPTGAAVKDALHLPLFAVLTVCLSLVFKTITPRLPVAANLAASAAVAVFIAAGSEWFQGRTGRSASAGDLVNDLLGIAVALLALIMRKKSARRPPLFTAVSAVAITAASVYAAAPVYAAWGDGNAQRRLFPDLGGFDLKGSIRYWKPQGESDSGASTTIKLVTSANGSAPPGGLFVKCAPAAWSGVSKFLPAGTRDWSGYHGLSLSIDNPGDPFVLGIRLDGAGSRISAEISLVTGTNPVRIPFDSDMWQPAPPLAPWLRNVSKLVLHTGESPVAHPFILTDIRLLPLSDPKSP